MKLQPRENAPGLGEVVGILRADQEVDVHEAGLRGDVEAQLDIGKEQRDIGQPPAIASTFGVSPSIVER